VSKRFDPLNPDEQLGYLIVRAAEVVSKPWLRGLREHGINPRQFSVLSILASTANLSQADLARRTNITPQSMGELLGVLEQSELISRGDQVRGVAATIVVTAKGRTVLSAAYPIVQRLQEESLTALDMREREVLAKLLRRLIASGTGNEGSRLPRNQPPHLR
jgi:DNA-binding MarR family transcriptional regulator